MSTKILGHMLGKTIKRVDGLTIGSSNVMLSTSDEVFVFTHDQECCEWVRVGDVVGTVSDLVGTPVVEASECSSNDTEDKRCLWTFYRFSTVKGTVTVRWLGESDGPYSVAVSMGVVAVSDSVTRSPKCESCNCENFQKMRCPSCWALSKPCLSIVNSARRIVPQ